MRVNFESEFIARILTKTDGANRTFAVRIKDENGQIKDITFSLYRDNHGVMRVNPPEQIKTAAKKR